MGLPPILTVEKVKSCSPLEERDPGSCASNTFSAANGQQNAHHHRIWHAEHLCCWTLYPSGQYSSPHRPFTQRSSTTDCDWQCCVRDTQKTSLPECGLFASTQSRTVPVTGGQQNCLQHGIMDIWRQQDLRVLPYRHSAPIPQTAQVAARRSDTRCRRVDSSISARLCQHQRTCSAL